MKSKSQSGVLFRGRADIGRHFGLFSDAGSVDRSGRAVKRSLWITRKGDSQMVPSNSPDRRHGEARDDFAVIVPDVQSRGLPVPGSSGDRQITIHNPVKHAPPKTVLSREAQEKPGSSTRPALLCRVGDARIRTKGPAREPVLFRHTGRGNRVAPEARILTMAVGRTPWPIPAGFNGETDQEVETIEFDFTGDGFIIELRFKPQQGRSTSVRASRPCPRCDPGAFGRPGVPVVAGRISRWRPATFRQCRLDTMEGAWARTCAPDAPDARVSAMDQKRLPCHL